MNTENLDNCLETSRIFKQDIYESYKDARVADPCAAMLLEDCLRIALKEIRSVMPETKQPILRELAISR